VQFSPLKAFKFSIVHFPFERNGQSDASISSKV
jgi:hypothetical protein